MFVFTACAPARFTRSKCPSDHCHQQQMIRNTMLALFPEQEVRVNIPLGTFALVTLEMIVFYVLVLFTPYVVVVCLKTKQKIKHSSKHVFLRSPKT